MTDQEELFSVERIRVQNLLDQATALVNFKKITAENAVLMVGTLVDTDLQEPTNELEKIVFDWLESMEKHF